MQIERMTMALRARNAWEGTDLGVVLLRDAWRPVYGATVCVVGAVALAAHWLIESGLLAALVVWWLKPLYDRVVLHVLGNALFGAPPGVRETLASLPRLLRGTGLLGALTLRRFDPARSFHLPVRQLERQAGAQARQRERVLARRTGGQTWALLYCCIGFELVVFVSAAAFADLVTPAALDGRGLGAAFAALFDDDAWHWLDGAFAAAAIVAIEPLYVAGGFGVYLNRRTMLEAWDLELRFRRLQPGPAAAVARMAAWPVVFALVLGSGTFSPHAAAADKSSQEIIREVLAAPEFQETRTITTWQLRDDGRESRRRFSFRMPEWTGSIGSAAAELARFAAYCALAAVLFIVLRFLLAELRAWLPAARRDAAAPDAPEAVFGLDARPEALPADLPQLAAAAARTDPRLALSLLYRGALASLIHRHRLPIEPGDTEADCVARVRATRPAAVAEYFSRLTAAWSHTAYGHHAPPAETLAALCAEWPRHFGAEAAS